MRSVTRPGFYLTVTSDLQIESKGSNSLIPDFGPTLGSAITLTPTNFLGFGTISLNYDACHLNQPVARRSGHRRIAQRGNGRSTAELGRLATATHSDPRDDG